MPAVASASSRSRPEGPTNGWPCRSSWSPGCSPTSITSAPRGPSPNTVWVASLQRWQPRQPAAAARSDGSVGRSGTNGAAEPAAIPVLPAIAEHSCPVEQGHRSTRDREPKQRLAAVEPGLRIGARLHYVAAVVASHARVPRPGTEDRVAVLEGL